MLTLLAIIYTMNTIQTNDNQNIEVLDDLTIEEITFSKLLAKGYSPTTAYRKAFPLKKNLAYNTIRQYARDLCQKESIVTEVATSKKQMATLARLAEDRLEDILINDDSTKKGNKVADVAMFMYEQANGKATQRIQTENKHVVVTYDLSGGKGGDVPQEILDQLQDDSN